METLSLRETATGEAINPASSLQQSGVSAPLPPQMFTTAAQLLDLTDKKLVLVLRDGRKVIGVLRSWDQFANLVLTEAVERLFVKEVYADIPRGLFVVRGENVLLLGEIDLDKDDYVPEPYQQVTKERAFDLQKRQKSATEPANKSRAKALQRLGFEAEHAGEALF